jgi:hypothetical protein
LFPPALQNFKLNLMVDMMVLRLMEGESLAGGLSKPTVFAGGLPTVTKISTTRAGLVEEEL